MINIVVDPLSIDVGKANAVGLQLYAWQQLPADFSQSMMFK